MTSAILSRIIEIIRANGQLGQVAMGDSISALMGGMMWLYFAMILSNADYGKINFVFALSTIGSWIAVGGFNSTIIRLHSINEEKYIRSLHSLAFFISCALGIAALLLNQDYLLPFLIISGTLFVMSVYENLGIKRYRRYMLLTVLSKLSQMVLSIVLYNIIGLEGILVGYIIPNFAFSFSGIRSIVLLPVFTDIKNVIRFSLSSFSINFTRVSVLYLDKVLVGIWFGYYSLGNYQFASQFLILLASVPASIFFFNLSKKDDGALGIKHVLIVAAALTVGFFVSSPFIIGGFFRNYTSSIFLAQLISISVFPMSISYFLTSKELKQSRYRIVILSSLSYIIASIILIYALGNIFGDLGFGLASTAANSIQLLVLIFFSKCNFAISRTHDAFMG